MKKLLYTLLAAAATLFVVGCEKELRNDSLDSSEFAQATFNVSFADAATKAISDGLTATQLVVGVYDKSGDTYVQSLSWTPDATDHKNAFSALNAKFTASLVKGHEYKIVFLAVAPDNGVYTIDLAAKTFTAAVSGPSNAEARDAFYGVWETEDKVSGAINANVVLKRPFAQINVIDLKADFEAAKDALVNFKESSLKVKAPKVLNIYDGTVATDADYVFAKAAMSVEHPDFEPYKTAGDYWILTDYILAGTASQTVDLEFALYDTAGAELVKYPVANVPIQRNYRTNIYGSLLTAGGEFNVIIAPEYDGMNEFPIEGKAPEITWTDTSLSNYADGTPMEFTLGEKETINFAASHPLATIKPTYTSSNPAVGTINEAGLFTVVGAGTTVVTVAFPAVVDGVAVKGADNTYASYSINYIVKVNPVVVELQDAELAVTGAPTAAVAAGGTFDLTVSSKSDAEITVAVAPTAAATVGAPVSGKYTVTAAADLTADTEVTVTFSQAATDTYKAASKEVKFTVLKKADDPQPAEVIKATVAEFLAAEVSSAQKYELTGKIAKHNGSVNATYGNFDLVDASGTVYVYGLTATEKDLTINADGTFKGNNDKSFADLGLEEDDTVTLIGYRGVYNEEVEVVGAYYVSHVKDTTPKFGAAINSESVVPAAGGTRTITVTGNVAWTASVTGAATLSAASGEGAGTITVTIPANNSETAEPEFVVKVSTSADVATKEYSFTIKQAKYVAPTGDEAALTNAEIVAALSAGSVTSNSYGDLTINSASGTWTACVNCLNTLTYLQIRNKSNANITSPVFDKNIQKIVISMADNTTANRTIYAVPVDTDLSSSSNFTQNTFEGNYGSVVTPAGESNLEIEFNADTKQFKLGVYYGAVYINSITVYFK